MLSLGNGVSPGEGLLGIIVADWSAGTDLIDLIAGAPAAGRQRGPAARAARRRRRTRPPRRPRARRRPPAADPGHPGRHAAPRVPRPAAGGRAARRRQGPRRDPVPAAHRPLAAAGRPGGHPAGAGRPGRLDRAAERAVRATSRRSCPRSPSAASRTPRSAASTPAPRCSAVLEQAADAAEQTEFLGPVARPVERGRREPVWTTRPPVPGTGPSGASSPSASPRSPSPWSAILAWLGTHADRLLRRRQQLRRHTVVVSQPHRRNGETRAARADSRPARSSRRRSRCSTSAARRTTRAARASPPTATPAPSGRPTRYKQQFPALKPGVGLMASFAESVRVRRGRDRLAEPEHGRADPHLAVGQPDAGGDQGDRRGHAAGRPDRDPAGRAPSRPSTCSSGSPSWATATGRRWPRSSSSARSRTVLQVSMATPRMGDTATDILIP